MIKENMHAFVKVSFFVKLFMEGSSLLGDVP